MAQGNPQAVAILLNCLLIQEYMSINKKIKIPENISWVSGREKPRKQTRTRLPRCRAAGMLAFLWVEQRNSTRPLQS